MQREENWSCAYNLYMRWGLLLAIYTHSVEWNIYHDVLIQASAVVMGWDFIALLQTDAETYDICSQLNQNLASVQKHFSLREFQGPPQGCMAELGWIC